MGRALLEVSTRRLERLRAASGRRAWCDIVRRMPSSRYHRRPDRQRALALLASSRDGTPEEVMTAYGFAAEQLDELVQPGRR